MDKNIDDLPDGPTETYRPKPRRENEGDDIYEKPTLQLKEQPKSDKRPNEGNMRDS